MATFNQKRIVGPVRVPTSASASTLPSSALYTVGTNTVDIIKQIIVTNTASAAKTYTLWLKPAAVALGSVNDTHMIFNNFTINANETTFINLSLVVEYVAGSVNAGDALYMRASDGTSLNVTISAVQETP